MNSWRRSFGLQEFLVLMSLLAGMTAGTAAAQDADQAPPPPDFLSRKRPLPKEILDQKEIGRYVTGMPLVGIDPEVGGLVGAAIQVFDNGPRTSPFFAYAPYRRQLSAGAQVGTSLDFWNVYLAFDQPYIDDTPWRLKTYVGYKVNKFANYFGTGEETLEPLHYPGSPRTFTRFRDFENAIESKSGGMTWSDYVSWGQELLVGSANLEHDLAGGLLRPLVGLQIGHVHVTDYSGDAENGAIQQETKLAEDDRLGKIRGFHGGWDNSLRLGVSMDLRDYEPDPTSGLLAQMFLTSSLRALGSEFNYAQVTFGLSGFIPVIPGYDDLI